MIFIGIILAIVWLGLALVAGGLIREHPFLAILTFVGSVAAGTASLHILF